MNDKFNIRIADWYNPTDQAALKHIRTLVFINEQNVPQTLEWDIDDATAIHFLASDHYAQPIACVRIVIGSDLNQSTRSTGKIGRMAVLPERRNKGVGTALLRNVMTYLYHHDIQHISLSAQVHAVGFYQRAGFVECSEPYQDAGIPHIDMQLVNQGASLV